MTVVKISEVCGLCYGANRAFSETNKNLDSGKNLVLFKELLHNPNVMKSLENKGASVCDCLEDISKDSLVIVRAHGEPLSTFEFFDKNNIEYVDCTCPNVKAINMLVKTKETEGYKIIIIGKHGFNGGKIHPEVAGTAGWCTNPIIIEDESEIEKIDMRFDKYFLTVQTTFSKDAAEVFIEKISNKMKLNNKVFEYKNTICNAQRNINDASATLAKEVDIMIVMGGKNSSNTKELFNNVSRFTKTFKIEVPEEVFDIDANQLKSAKTIGLTAGASTLMEDIVKLKTLIENICNK